jgi:hypothetical protein
MVNGRAEVRTVLFLQDCAECFVPRPQIARVLLRVCRTPALNMATSLRSPAVSPASGICVRRTPLDGQVLHLDFFRGSFRILPEFAKQLS